MELDTKEKKKIFIVAFIFVILVSISWIWIYNLEIELFRLNNELNALSGDLSKQASTVQQIVNFLNQK